MCQLLSFLFIFSLLMGALHISVKTLNQYSIESCVKWFMEIEFRTKQWSHQFISSRNCIQFTRANRLWLYECVYVYVLTFHYTVHSIDGNLWCKSKYILLYICHSFGEWIVYISLSLSAEHKFDVLKFSFMQIENGVWIT